MLAFAAGLLSISSPCCLPLLPGYLSYLSGVSPAELGRNRGRTVLAALPFVALSFWVVGLRSLFGRVAHGAAIVQSASGALLVAMGILLVTDRWLPLMATILIW